MDHVGCVTCSRSNNVDPLIRAKMYTFQYVLKYVGNEWTTKAEQINKFSKMFMDA